MTVYMKVTRDKYELPLAVADSVSELAMLTGKNSRSISRVLCRAQKKDHPCIYVKVEIDDDE